MTQEPYIRYLPAELVQQLALVEDLPPSEEFRAIKSIKVRKRILRKAILTGRLLLPLVHRFWPGATDEPDGVRKLFLDLEISQQDVLHLHIATLETLIEHEKRPNPVIQDPDSPARLRDLAAQLANAHRMRDGGRAAGGFNV